MMFCNIWIASRLSKVILGEQQWDMHSERQTQVQCSHGSGCCRLPVILEARRESVCMCSREREMLFLNMFKSTPHCVILTKTGSVNTLKISPQSKVFPWNICLGRCRETQMKAFISISLLHTLAIGSKCVTRCKVTTGTMFVNSIFFLTLLQQKNWSTSSGCRQFILFSGACFYPRGSILADDLDLRCC